MWCSTLCLILSVLPFLKCYEAADDVTPIWQWVCERGICLKYPYEKTNDAATSLEACKMFCNEYGLLWPQPTGEVNLGKLLSNINLNNIDVESMKHGKSDTLMQNAVQRFKKMIPLTVPQGLTPKSHGKSVVVYLVNHNPDVNSLSLSLDESYNLYVTTMLDERINATISASNFFGVRHGLETLTQLFIYDDIRNEVQIVRNVQINDKPVYPYRGLLLDTARNYYSVESIKATLDAMASVKLNTFHWHITDSQSFPFVSERQPHLSKYGAYSPLKVYSKATIKDIVQYGLLRGVRVMPEFDAPAHVGEGWQNSELVVCFKAEPWKEYCVEPPCGQLNPIKEELYDVLEDIYTDLADAFQTDIFHMGGDEVAIKCWNSSEEIQQFMIQNRWDLNDTGYIKLWDYFQNKAQERAYKAFGKEVPLILWTSKLTEPSHIMQYVNKDKYILQVWTTGFDPRISELLKLGYRLILSNYDALYLDCGYGAWIGSGNNWCSPYSGWQKVYDNSPASLPNWYREQVLGGEAALWSEQSDSSTVGNKLWPRAAALAERLWAEPDTQWKNAEYRMLQVRNRLVRMGIQADSIEPEWCYQNEGYCY